MKAFFKTGLILTWPLFFAACSESAGPKEVSDNADAVADSVATGMQVNKDEEFVEDMLEENTEAIAWLKAGAAMGTDAGLKKDAASMLTEHEAMNIRLRGIASAKAYEVDDLDAEDTTADATKEKPGAGWDDDWADRVASRHRKMMERLDDFSDDTKDAEITAFINDARPKLAAHLKMSEVLAGRLED